MPAIIFAQNKQLILEVTSEIYWKNEKHFSQGYLGYKKFPDKFFGIGSDTPDENEEDFTPKFTRFEANIQRRFLPSIYGGISYEIETYKIIELIEGGMLASGKILGSEGGNTAGVGNVSDTLQNFDISNFKTSAGIGFRFRVNPQEKLNIRFDRGIGQNTSGIYITINEAF